MNHKSTESKRQVVKDLLEGKRVERLLFIPNALTISAAKYGYSIPEIISDPVKMAECVGGYREKIGYDGYCAGLAMEGYMSQIAGHLPDSDGTISGSGADTVHSAEDLDKLKPYNMASDRILRNIAETVRLLREREPDEPIYVIFNNPAQTAMKLMGENSGYRAMRKDPQLFLKVMDYVEEDLIERCLYLWELGLDYLWEPIPCFSGNCISRTLYEQLIYRNNARFNQRLVDKGVKIVIHTCGKFGDRYDLVRQEYGCGWHIAVSDTRMMVETYGDEVAIIGNLDCIADILERSSESLYERAVQDAMAGAPSGRFILSSDCDISPKTSDENMRAIVRAARDVQKKLDAEGWHYTDSKKAMVKKELIINYRSK